ncbi:hypothetical protein Tco_0767801 [Tanacetum coccineum]
MKLNPKKCTFDAEEGMFMGHVVNTKGIKACSEKVEAVVKLQSPRTLKEVQSLNGKLTSLNRFLSKSVKNSLTFFKTLKRCIKKNDFQWTLEAEKEFWEIKHQIAELPMLTVPKPNMSCITKLGNKLHPHGKSRSNIIARNKKVDKVLPSLANSSHHRPTNQENLVKAREFRKNGKMGSGTRSSYLEGSRAGLILKIPEGAEFTYALRFEFDASNNEAEYEALIAGL